MANPEWGAKHTCQNCGVKYYDLQRSPIVCPKCKTAFNPDALLRSRRGKPAAPEKAPAAVPAVAQAAVAEVAVAEGEEAAAEEPEKEASVALEGAEEGADEKEGEGEGMEKVAESDDEGEKLIEDASELGEDDEVVAEVVVGDGEPKDA